MYNFALLDENSKREVRRALLKAIAIPGFQVPFASRELSFFFRGLDNGRQNILGVDAQTRRRIQNNDFGIVYQNPHLGLNFHVSGEGNVAERMLVADCRHFQSIQDKVHDLFARVELPPSRFKDFPGSYSGGMQQRVQIAKALISRPSLILLDEPTASLDRNNREITINIIQELKKQNITMIGIFHDPVELARLSDEMLPLKRPELYQHIDIDENFTESRSFAFQV